MSTKPRAQVLFVLLFSTLGAWAASPIRSTDPLVAVDLHRGAIVSDIVAGFRDEAIAANPDREAESVAELEARLAGLRADRLLAASLASSYGALRSILNETEGSMGAERSRVHLKSLGDPAADLVYTPLAPCRMIDTRGFGAPFQGGAFAPDERRTYAPAGACGIPTSGVAALTVSFASQNLKPPGGFLAMVAPAAPITGIVGVYSIEWISSNTTIATGPAGQFDVYVNTANPHVIIDVLGYFRAPQGGAVTSITTGTGLTGGTITSTGTISADTTYLQRRVSTPCPVGSSIRGITADGSVTCQTDNSGSTNALVQGGNAFGATATLGTTDNQSVSIVANNVAALRITPHATSPSLVGGHSGNSITAGAAAAVVAGGGTAGTTDPFFSTCGSSCANRVTDHGGVVGGGAANQAGDGLGTTSDRPYSTVSGGFVNTASGARSSVGGGQLNTASGLLSIVSGGGQNAASGEFSTVGGGLVNAASNHYSTVGGGTGNMASGDHSTVGGGSSNMASGSVSTIGGGSGNSANGQYSTVGGGSGNSANNPINFYSTVGGGNNNAASRSYSSIGGGINNWANGLGSTIPGGSSNTASGNDSFAAGKRAKTETSGGTVHDGAFVWADGNNFDFYSTATNEFSARATGGVRFVTAIDGSGTPTAGVAVAAGGGSWASLSDVNAKVDFASLDARSVLAKVAALPIRSWRYKTQDASIRHIGPTAQDFRAAFAVGESDRTITTVDADGVALAAIQGLDQVVREKDAEKDALLARQQARIERLENALAAILARLGPARQ